MKIHIIETKLPASQRKQLLKEFIKFCIQELKLESPLNCKITLTNDKKRTTSYAHFNPSDNKIVVYLGDRSLGDVARSTCHELVHYKQNTERRLGKNSGRDGSPEENEANSLAGIVMRKFSKIHPEILEK